MSYSIVFNIEFKEKSINTLKFAINYFSTHPRPGLNNSWSNPLYSRILFDESNEIIFLSEDDENNIDTWDPSFGDDIAEFLIPFVKGGEVTYEDLNNSKTVISYSPNNKAKNFSYFENDLQEEYEFEYVWKMADFPIISHLILNSIYEDSKFNKTINLVIIEQDLGFTDEIVENTLYSLIGKQLIKGPIDTSKKLFYLEEIKNLEEQIKVCSRCFEKMVSNDRYCSFCGNLI